MAQKINRPTPRINRPTPPENKRVVFPLHRINLILMAIAGAMIVLGFVLMTGDSTSMESFNSDIFSTRRIIVGPAIAFLGFIFMGFGIIYRSKKEK